MFNPTMMYFSAESPGECLKWNELTLLTPFYTEDNYPKCVHLTSNSPIREPTRSVWSFVYFFFLRGKKLQLSKPGNTLRRL